ncbi:MAG: hypothetical protein RLZZ164_401, partial [Actinomycetota bacterium]
AAGLVGALSAYLTHLGTFGVILDGVLMAAVSIAIFQLSRRNRVGAHNVRSEVEGAAKTVASPRQVRKAAEEAAKAAKKANKKSAKKSAPKSKGKK